MPFVDGQRVHNHFLQYDKRANGHSVVVLNVVHCLCSVLFLIRGNVRLLFYGFGKDKIESRYSKWSSARDLINMTPITLMIYHFRRILHLSVYVRKLNSY